MGKLKTRVDLIERKIHDAAGAGAGPKSSLALITYDERVYHSVLGKTYAADALPGLAKRHELILVYLPDNGRGDAHYA